MFVGTYEGLRTGKVLALGSIRPWGAAGALSQGYKWPEVGSFVDCRPQNGYYFHT